MPEQRDEFGLSALLLYWEMGISGGQPGQELQHKGVQTVLASVERGQELADSLGPAPCFR